MRVELGFLVRIRKSRRLCRDLQTTAQMEKLRGLQVEGLSGATRGGLLARRLMGPVGFSS